MSSKELSLLDIMRQCQGKFVNEEFWRAHSVLPLLVHLASFGQIGWTLCPTMQSKIPFRLSLES